MTHVYKLVVIQLFPVAVDIKSCFDSLLERSIPSENL